MQDPSFRARENAVLEENHRLAFWRLLEDPVECQQVSILRLDVVLLKAKTRRFDDLENWPHFDKGVVCLRFLFLDLDDSLLAGKETVEEPADFGRDRLELESHFLNRVCLQDVRQPRFNGM